MKESGCFKEKSFSNGDVYIGEFKNNLRHGNGKYIWSNGTIYEGDWKNNKEDGRGIMKWTNGNVLDGCWKEGKGDGCGIIKWASGSVFYGCWSNGFMRYGVYRFANGDVYIGSIKGSTKSSLRHGNGTENWKDGSIYNGNWKNDKRDGKGIMKWASGDVFDGCWSNDLKHGSGVYRFANGDVCIGNFKRNFLHGKGMYTSSNGTIYKGYWDDGTVTGKIPMIKDLQNLVGDCMLLLISNQGQFDTSGLSCLVIKSKYIQGVLIIEKIGQNSEITHVMDKLSVKPVKKSSSKWTFFKTVKAKLKLNLQLCIRGHDNVKE